MRWGRGGEGIRGDQRGWPGSLMSCCVISPPLPLLSWASSYTSALAYYVLVHVSTRFPNVVKIAGRLHGLAAMSMSTRRRPLGMLNVAFLDVHFDVASAATS